MDVEIHLFIGSVILLILAVSLAVLQQRTNTLAPTVLVNRKRKVFRNEKRIFPRYTTSLRLKYKSPDEEGVSWIKDISRGGARLYLSNVDIGTILAVEISLPYDKKPIFAQGEIVWTHGSDSGFSFGAVEQGDLKRIIEYSTHAAEIRTMSPEPQMQD